MKRKELTITEVTRPEGTSVFKLYMQSKIKKHEQIKNALCRLQTVFRVRGEGEGQEKDREREGDRGLQARRSRLSALLDLAE